METNTPNKESYINNITIYVQAHEACKHFHVRLRFKRNVLESYHARDLANRELNRLKI
jgi:hypothetical protein